MKFEELEIVKRKIVKRMNRAISAKWSIETNHDMQALFDPSIRNYLANKIIEQIDIEIVEACLKDPEDIRDPKTYREEILVKKYEFK